MDICVSLFVSQILIYREINETEADRENSLEFNIVNLQPRRNVIINSRKNEKNIYKIGKKIFFLSLDWLINFPREKSFQVDDFQEVDLKIHRPGLYNARRSKGRNKRRGRKKEKERRNLKKKKQPGEWYLVRKRNWWKLRRYETESVRAQNRELL